MKNKEIEKILKYLKNNTYIPDETKRKYKILHRDEVNLLLSYIEQLEKQAELREHYKHLYSEVKKQKDDVVKFVNEFIREDYYEKLDEYITHFTWNTTKEDLLRMLGEIDNE